MIKTVPYAPILALAVRIPCNMRDKLLISPCTRRVLLKDTGITDASEPVKITTFNDTRNGKVFRVQFVPLFKPLGPDQDEISLRSQNQQLRVRLQRVQILP